MKGRILITSDQYNKLRKKFWNIISKINSVANY